MLDPAKILSSNIYLRRIPSPLHLQHTHTSSAVEREREPQPEAAVSFRTVVTFVTWLISRTEFSSSELVL